MKNLFVIGYSGHAFVVIESAINAGYAIKGYFENEEKALNPFGIRFAGSEKKFNFSELKQEDGLFVAIGDNIVRKQIYDSVLVKNNWCNVVDTSACLTKHLTLGNAIYIGKRVVINPLSSIGNGTIINTAAVIEHECTIGKFTHIAPMSILCGNVTVGDQTIIGANSVVRPGITIGSNVVIGAGSVITKNIPDNCKVYGNPARIIK